MRIKVLLQNHAKCKIFIICISQRNIPMPCKKRRMMRMNTKLAQHQINGRGFSTQNHFANLSGMTMGMEVALEVMGGQALGSQWLSGGQTGQMGVGPDVFICFHFSMFWHDCMLAQEFAYESIFICWITLADITLFNGNMETFDWCNQYELETHTLCNQANKKGPPNFYLEFSSTMFIMCTITYMIYIF